MAPSSVILAALAFAEVTPPDYRDSLMEGAASEVRHRAVDEGPEAAEAFASRWERTIGPDGRLAYEVALAWRLGGNEEKARRGYDRAIKLAPELGEAWHDRGEMRLNDGDLDGAEADFHEVIRLRPEHWVGYWRLADIAARRGDHKAFESRLIEALRRGFTVRTVVEDPRWRDYLADPRLGPVLRKLVVVYQDESLLEEMERR